MRKIYCLLVLFLTLLVTGCSSSIAQYDAEQQGYVAAQILQQYALGSNDLTEYTIEMETHSVICKAITTEILYIVSDNPNSYVAVCKSTLDIGIEIEAWKTCYFRIHYHEDDKVITDVEVLDYGATV